MIFTKADRDLLCELKAYLYGLRDGTYSRIKDLSDGQDRIMQSHAGLAREFEKIGGFIETRVKPLTDDEKFDWAKNILFMHGYVTVKMEDARQATTDKPQRVKPPAKSRKK